MVNALNLGKQTVLKKRLALVLEISSSTSFDIASNMTNLPFLVAAILISGKEQFLCPVVGEHKPRLQDVMCDLSYTSYKNKMLMTGIAGFPPYFTIQEQKTDGVDVKFLKYLTEKKNLQLNIVIFNSTLAAVEAVCLRDSLPNTIFPIY